MPPPPTPDDSAHRPRQLHGPAVDAKSLNPGDYQNTPGLAAVMPKRFPNGFVVAAHEHVRAQLIFATSGVVEVTANHALWRIPPQKALWIPQGMPHAMRACGDVEMRTAYVSPEAYGQSAPPVPRMVNVSPLLRELIVRVAAFNIASSLIMLVKDKGRDIGILRTMGASQGAIMRVFLITGAAVGVVGDLVGFLAPEAGSVLHAPLVAQLGEIALDRLPRKTASAADGRNENLSFTDVDRSASGGFSFKGSLWERPSDTIGIGAMINGLSRAHRDYFAAGGLGLVVAAKLHEHGVDVLERLVDRALHVLGEAEDRRTLVGLVRANSLGQTFTKQGGSDESLVFRCGGTAVSGSGRGAAR